MKRLFKFVIWTLLIMVPLYGAAYYAHQNVPHTCPRAKTRALHGCHHTDDPEELRQADENAKKRSFAGISDPCTCPIFCFINGSPGPLMGWD
jgi:hypothetical protein